MKSVGALDVVRLDELGLFHVVCGPGVRFSDGGREGCAWWCRVEANEMGGLMTVASKIKSTTGSPATRLALGLRDKEG